MQISSSKYTLHNIICIFLIGPSRLYCQLSAWWDMTTLHLIYVNIPYFKVMYYFYVCKVA